MKSKKVNTSMENVMIDLETLGTTPDSVFLSIAAVPFDLKNKEISKIVLNVNVELKSALEHDRTISPQTLEWWLTQNHKHLLEMFKNPYPLRTCLNLLTEFFNKHHLVYPWGNSASFDLGMLSHAYNDLGMQQPWSFRNERCYRTISNFLPKQLPKDKKKAHNPLYDCEYQIKNLFQLSKSF